MEEEATVDTMEALEKVTIWLKDNGQEKLTTELKEVIANVAILNRRKRLLEGRNAFLTCLENCGMNNWNDYDQAQRCWKNGREIMNDIEGFKITGCGGNLKAQIFGVDSLMEYCSRVAANPMTVGLSLAEKPPKSLDKLAQCKVASGHDVFLNSLYVHFDWQISKVIREQLLRYRFINVTSSQSLMHRIGEHILVPNAWGDVDNQIKNSYFAWSSERERTEEELVNNLPLGFKYLISFSCNYRQLKTIYAQRKNHKMSQWREFCNLIEKLPNSHWICGDVK